MDFIKSFITSYLPPDFSEHGFHIDYTYSHKGAIFSINSNNGYTILEDGTKIESVENRLVSFPAEMRHSGTTCTDEQARVVINLNYF